MYSLGVIGKSRKPWLREPVEMTVEYIKAVAAHLCCHHQVLGAVGSSIGPSKWAQSSWSGIHSSNWGISWAQSQVRYVLPSIIPICMLVVLKRTWTGAWYSCGLIPMTVRSTPRQFGLLHPTTASCQLGLKWRNTASFSHPASKLAAWSTAEPWHGGVGREEKDYTKSYRCRTNSCFLVSATNREENPPLHVTKHSAEASSAERGFSHLNWRSVDTTCMQSHFPSYWTL